MQPKRILLLLLAVLVVAGLIYLQVREWRHFEWGKFWGSLGEVRKLNILWAVALVYLADAIRAIRWKIFLRPIRPRTSWTRLIAPQYIGFAGLAIFGRPGEFVRPYLISKRVSTRMAPQVAIWLVERFFDTATVILMFTVAVFFAHSVKNPSESARVVVDQYDSWRRIGYFGGPVIALLLLALWAMWARGPAIAKWVCRQASRFSKEIGSSIENKLQSLSAGLHTIRDRRSLLEVTALSFAIWFTIAFAYRFVTHAFPTTDLDKVTFAQLILLMFASVAGGVLQLPVLGGGTQLATIAVLQKTFSSQPEDAVACGMLLWLVTFMSVIPGGLILARREHISLRRLESEAGEEAKVEDAAGPTLPLP